MKYVVCSNYCGSVIELEVFDNEELAEEFSKYPFTLFDRDESIDQEEEVIYPNEMWIEEYYGPKLQDEPELFVFDYISGDSELPF